MSQGCDTRSSAAELAAANMRRPRPPSSMASMRTGSPLPLVARCVLGGVSSKAPPRANPKVSSQIMKALGRRKKRTTNCQSSRSVFTVASSVSWD